MMNITIRLPFKIIKNDEAINRAKSKEELQSIVKDADNKFNDKLKDIEKQVVSLNTDLIFWKQQFKKQSPKKRCTKCKEPIDVWPFNYSESYYIKGNRVTHQTCPKSSIKEK